MLANQQENNSYQNKQRRDPECHHPQSATSSRGRLFGVYFLQVSLTMVKPVTVI
jgi:hypothetical protein